MLDSYLFIPADKVKFIDKIPEIESDYFVVDLEDSVSISKKGTALDNVLSRNFDKNVLFRIPFIDNVYSKDELIILISKSKGNIVIPKVRNLVDMSSIFSLLKGLNDLKLILLVENPECLLNLKDILFKYNKNISGVALGSHDFCSETGIKHESKYLNPIKNQLSLIVKAFGINVLDGVDVNIRDFEELKKECLIAFEMGMKGKFFIHPNQLIAAREVQYLSNPEIELIKRTIDKIKDFDDEEIDVIEINGVVYEKPHLNRIIQLFNKIKQYEG